MQQRVGSVTGFDLSGATIHPRSATAQAAGVDGLAHGRDVHLAPGIEPGTHHGDTVLAHELAHVVQQATGRRGGVATNEADADAVAAHAASAAPSRAVALAPLPAPRDLAVQLFDPRYHRTSTVQGLEGSGFTPDEIGMIYAANWERDLSQAHPALGNVIVAWKSVKVAAFEKRLTEGDMAHFQGACQAVLESAIESMRATGGTDAFLDATAYGGYQFYEHMDNPEGTPQAGQMKVVLGTKNTQRAPRPHVHLP